MARQNIAIRINRYVFGTPSTTLEFGYTEQGLDEIRSGHLPDSVAARLTNRTSAVVRRAIKVFGPLLVVFALIAGGIAATAEHGRVAAPVFVMACYAVFAGIFSLRVWWNFRRPAKSHALKRQTLRAYKSTADFQVRFGQTAMTGKSWSMDGAAYRLINGDELYNVYSVADMLVYLEEVEEPAAS